MSSSTAAEPGAIDVIVETQEEADQLADDLVARLVVLAKNSLCAMGVRGPAEVNLTFVGVAEIESLNSEHMGKSGPTDVLSFPLDGGEPSATEAPAMVGDIVIAPAVAALNAPSHAGTLQDELALLVVHSCLHLLGHDHAAPEEEQAMWLVEKDLMSLYWSDLQRDPWS